MFKKIILATLLLIFPLAMNSQESSSVDPQAKLLVEKMINRLRGHVNISLNEMTVKRPAWTRTMKLKTWDARKDKKVFVRILEPAKDQGTSFLRIGYNLWSYLPKIEKTMKIPPSMMLQSWMGSDFTNDDLVKESSYIDDYHHKILAEEKKEGKTVTQIELMPKENAPVVWGKVLFWVWKEESLPLEQSFFDEKGKLIKNLKFSEFIKMDGLLFPSIWEMKNMAKEGESTTLKTLSIDFDPTPAIPESVFTQQNFGKMD